MRYVITVNRDRIDKGEPRPIRVEDTRDGSVAHYAAVRLLPTPGQFCANYGENSHAAVLRSGEARQDGATVWIECEEVEVIA